MKRLVAFLVGVSFLLLGLTTSFAKDKIVIGFTSPRRASSTPSLQSSTAGCFSGRSGSTPRAVSM